jgi:hypothetical protein
MGQTTEAFSSTGKAFESHSHHRTLHNSLGSIFHCRTPVDTMSYHKLKTYAIMRHMCLFSSGTLLIHAPFFFIDNLVSNPDFQSFSTSMGHYITNIKVAVGCAA